MTAPNRDFEVWEIASAVIIALCVQVGTATGMYLAKYDVAECKLEDQPVCPKGTIAKCVFKEWICKPSCDAPPPDCPEGEQPECSEDSWVCKPPSVAVKPALDPFAAEGAQMPTEWKRADDAVKKQIQEQPPVIPPDTTVVSTKPQTNDIPDASTVVTPDAFGDGAPLEESDAPREASDTDAGPQEGADSGDPTGSEDGSPTAENPDGGGASGGDGCQGPACKDGGTGDMAASIYLNRLIGFFRRGFVVSGLGLTPEEIKGLSVSVSVTLSGDGTVTGFTMGSSGNATFDAAARSAMQGKVGSQVPPPPEDRPEFKKNSLSFSMTCSSACN